MWGPSDAASGCASHAAADLEGMLAAQAGPRRDPFGSIHPPSAYLYHNEDLTGTGRIRSIYGESLPRIEAGHILDLGCSVGLTTRELSELYPGCAITGIDRDPVRIAKAQATCPGEQPGIAFLVDDGYDSTLDPCSFAAVFCDNNIYYVARNIGRDKALMRGCRHIAGLVAPHGYLCISGSPDFCTTYEHLILRKSAGLLVVHSNAMTPRRRDILLDLFNAGA